MEIKVTDMKQKEIENIYRGYYPGKPFRCCFYDGGHTFKYYFKTMDLMAEFFNRNAGKYRSIEKQKRTADEWSKI